MTKLKNWSFIMSGGPYQAPECCDLRLSGEVYDHPGRHFDGKAINTSPVRDILQDTKQVVCASRTYQLDGPPDVKWVEWLKRQGIYDKYADLCR